VQIQLVIFLNYYNAYARQYVGYIQGEGAFLGMINYSSYLLMLGIKYIYPSKST
jgi:hypothetical protein